MRLDTTLARLRKIDSDSVDRIITADSQDVVESRYDDLREVIGKISKNNRVPNSYADWITLTAGFFAIGQAQFERGLADQARESFQRAATFSLLIGDATLRVSALESAENPHIESNQTTETTAPPSSESGNSEVERIDYSDEWKTIDSEKPSESVGLPSLQERCVTNAGTEQELTAAPATPDDYQTLERALAEARTAQDDVQTVLLANQILDFATSTLPPPKELLAESAIAKIEAMTRPGYTQELAQAVNQIISTFSLVEDRDWAGDSLLQCYRHLIHVKEATTERLALIEAAQSSFDATSSVQKQIDCDLELGIESQRTGDYKSAYTSYQRTVETARRNHLPATFTKASFLLGDTWAIAVRKQKVDQVSGYSQTLRYYLESVNQFEESEYTTSDDKKTLGIAYLKLVSLLSHEITLPNQPAARPSQYAEKAYHLFRELGMEARADQARKYMED